MAQQSEIGVIVQKVMKELEGVIVQKVMNISFSILCVLYTGQASCWWGLTGTVASTDLHTRDSSST